MVLRLRRSPTLPSIALALLLIVGGLMLMMLTRGTTFWFDDWTWVEERRGNSIGTFLRPHNGHLSLLPVLVYRALFATAGLTTYVPYRAVMVVLVLACAGLVFEHIRRRVGAPLGLLGAAVLLTLGPAWQNLLWPFQMAWLLSIGCGLGALLALERPGRRGDTAAAALLGLSIASSGIGLPIAAGAAVELLWGRRRVRALWIVGVPLFFYAIWWLSYQDNNFIRAAHAFGIADPITSGILRAPRYAADSAAASMGALSGLDGQLFADSSTSGQSLLEWGAPLTVAGVGALLWAMRRPGVLSARLLSLITIPVLFWIFTSITRSFISAPYTSRYIFVGGVFIMLIAAEVARGALPLRPGWLAGVATVGLMALVTNVGVMRDAGRFLRRTAQDTRASVTAMELARPLVPRGFATNPIFGIHAGPYFAARDALGSPAFTEAQLLTALPSARGTADADLARIHDIKLTQLGPRDRAAGSPPPAVARSTGGTVGRQGGCVRLLQPAYRSPGSASDLQVTVPAAGLLLHAEGGAAQVGVRRFGDGPQAAGTLSSGGSAVLRIGPDLAKRPWLVDLSGMPSATVCTLG